MGNGESDRLRQRILEAPYGHPQVEKSKGLLHSVREGATVHKRHREPVEVGDRGAISVIAPIVVEKPHDVIDLQLLPRENHFLSALAHAGVGLLYEMTFELEDVIDDL